MSSRIESRNACLDECWRGNVKSTVVSGHLHLATLDLNANLDAFVNATWYTGIRRTLDKPIATLAERMEISRILPTVIVYSMQFNL